MFSYEATADFSTALSEVDLLIRASASNDDDLSAQNALNKAAILLLTAKLESFFEQIVEEFCYQLSSMALPCERLPNPVRIHASRRLLNEDFLCTLDRCNEEKVLPAMQALSLLWHDGCVPQDIRVDTSFTYGKHGEKEIRRLFQRVGVNDIFETCKIPYDQETLAVTDRESTDIVTSDVNALTGLRNFIIHNDGTPNVTHVQISRYRNRLFSFAEKIDQCLGHTRNSIEMPTANDTGAGSA